MPGSSNPIDTAPGPERISDPRRVRALAHRLRLELLELLSDGEMTASDCAAASGESVASCSYHLGILAKYGYIVRGEPRGREKPWRLASQQREIRPDVDDHASVIAVAAIAALALDREVEHVHSWIDQLPAADPAWVDASTITTAAVWVTVEEFVAISRALKRITVGIHDRDDPSIRPPGSRPVRILGVASVDVGREARGRRT